MAECVPECDLNFTLCSMDGKDWSIALGFVKSRLRTIGVPWNIIVRVLKLHGMRYILNPNRRMRTFLRVELEAIPDMPGNLSVTSARTQQKTPPSKHFEKISLVRGAGTVREKFHRLGLTFSMVRFDCRTDLVGKERKCRQHLPGYWQWSEEWNVSWREEA